jgi:hypothetical protein
MNNSTKPIRLENVNTAECLFGYITATGTLYLCNGIEPVAVSFDKVRLDDGSVWRAEFER